MPARKKIEKFTEVIQIRVTPALKKRVDEMADETRVAISDTGRTLFESEVTKWEKSRNSSK